MPTGAARRRPPRKPARRSPRSVGFVLSSAFQARSVRGSISQPRGHLGCVG